MRLLLPLLFAVLPFKTMACDLALVLAVDVSGSVDRHEYRIQMEGLAAALRNGIVVDALVEQSAQVSLIQWSGSSRQMQSVSWTEIRSEEDVEELAAEIAAVPRQWRNYSTAIGEALALSVRTLEAVPQCKRKVIDVSGDGVSNEGIAPQDMRPVLGSSGVTVNALVIETDDMDLTAYFFEHVIEGEGAFVVTANGFDDYPAQILRKLQRETTKQLSRLE